VVHFIYQVIIPLKMTEPIVQPEDIETPVQVEPEVPENDDELEPEADPLPPENETAEQKDARIAALADRNEKLWARLQREKNKGNTVTKPTPAAKPVSATPASLTRDEAIVIAKGFSEEELEHAKKVAALEGIKVTEAVTNDLFTAWKSKRDAEVKQRDAQLPTSRGARSATSKKTLSTPGLPAAEHEALWREKQGR
jgi:hypothetical protein